MNTDTRPCARTLGGLEGWRGGGLEEGPATESARAKNLLTQHTHLKMISALH